MQHMLRAGALVANAQRIADLADRQQQRRRAHEAEDDGFRDIAGEVAEPEHGDEDLDRAHHRAEQEHRLRGLDALIGVEDRKGAEHHQRDRAGRAVDQVRGRTEQRGHGGDDDRRIESVARIDAREQRIGHALRQRDRGDRQAAPRGRGAALGRL